ncbi:hypothetical protein AgCh_007063 [Apium graveolens]
MNASQCLHEMKLLNVILSQGPSYLVCYNVEDDWIFAHAKSLADRFQLVENMELPPQLLLERLAQELRHRLGLHLFNLDIIRERGSKDRFYVIDINYFPGYGKVPDYEHMFTNFLLSLVQSKYKTNYAGAC